MAKRRVLSLLGHVALAALLWASVTTSATAAARFASGRYALILEDPPVSTQYASRDTLQSVPAQTMRQQIQARQQVLRTELVSRRFAVTGSVQTLLNAIFVVAPPDREAELKALPGVKAVVPLRRYRLNLNRAVELVNAPGAWNGLGGVQNAGSGIKIAIIDTGIDQTHPAFQDSSLAMPAGFPICSGSDCGFTSNKVIVARSYVSQLAAGTSTDPAATSRPDDYSPRDRIGHGTAVASCAAGVTNTGLLTITGVAPKAYLGNYKIFGSPELNDFSSDDVIVQALEDALHDGMDIASLSLGGPALSGPLDSGAICGNPSGVPCDVAAQAVENAVAAGMTVVTAAGNEGDTGYDYSSGYPTYNTIGSPGTAPSAIAVGATTNSHVFVQSVRLPGTDVPSGLEQIAAYFGDGVVPTSPLTAPLRDVARLGNDGLACTALASGSLTGAIALIERGSCYFADKVTYAQMAGAVGVIFYMADQSAPFPPGGLSGTGIPAAMISNADGLSLKSFLVSHPGHSATLDPAGMEQDTSSYNLLAGFSSLGPATGGGLKPDLVAVGTQMYMATQHYDLFGEMYSTDGYTVADGTSFSTPLVSGAAALVKQANPAFTPAQIRSALINTATQDVPSDDSGNVVTVQSIGAGKLDAGAAVKATVTANPATVSFGVLTTASLPLTTQLQIVNSGASSASLSLAVAPGTSGGLTPVLGTKSLSLAGGASSTVSVTLSGTRPSAGSYSGAITIQGQNVSLRVPYLYLVGNGKPNDLLPLAGSFTGTVGQSDPDGIIAIGLIDPYGVPVAGAAVSFQAIDGGAFLAADTVTDANGIAAAQPVLGVYPGSYTFTVTASAGTAGTLGFQFSGLARLTPTINPSGIVNGASFASGKAIAPGSYISLFGTSLSDVEDWTPSAFLPLALDYVSVSFDVPSAGLSLPGRLLYVSPLQVNVQVPWELQGQTSAKVKVTIDTAYGNLYTLSLADYSPAFFEVTTGVAAALDSSNNIIGAGNPAQRGQSVQLFANGLGPVTNQPATGEPAVASPLSETTTVPVVTIGSATAPVSFYGLAPGFAGLYQINATVPATLAAGTYPIAISIGGVTSPSSTITIR